MSTMTVYVHVSPADAALGDGRHGVLPVEVDLDSLDADSRDLFARALRETVPVELSNRGYRCPWLAEPGEPDHIWSLPEASPDALRDALRAKLDSKAAREAEVRAALAAEEARARAKLAKAHADLLAGAVELVSVYDDAVTVTGYVGGLIPRTPDIEPLIAEFERAQAERGAAERAEKERIERQQKEGEQALRQWAIEHGSERLQLMLEMGTGDWERLAHTEYYEAMAPNYGGVKFSRDVWQESGVGTPRKMPTVAELRALQAMREAAQVPGSIVSDPQLRYCVVEPETDDADAHEEKFTVLRVTLTAPDGDREYVAIRL